MAHDERTPAKDLPASSPPRRGGAALPGLPALSLCVLAVASLAPAAAARHGDSVWPNHFESLELQGGLVRPTDLAFLADGRMLIAEKTGRVRAHDGETLQGAAFLDLQDEVNKTGDRGLLGLALHPGFLPDGGPTSWVYLIYTVSPVPGADPQYNDDDKYSFGRLVRYRATTSAGNLIADPASRQVLLGNQLPDGTAPDALPNLHSSHANGSLVFGADGSLLVTAGDGAHFDQMDTGGLDDPGFEDFTHPVTGLKGPMPVDQDCGALRAQDLRSLGGKVLRLDPETGFGYPSNPFFDGDPSSNASRVWALGLRNPYRSMLVPGTGSSDPALGEPGTLLVGDVGWQDWEELNRCFGGENFGWPCFEGPLPEEFYGPFEYGSNPMGFPDCGSLGPGVLTPALVAWEHDDPSLQVPPGVHVDELGNPLSGFSGSCVVAGTYYPGGDYPPEYAGRFFFADYADDWIRTMTLDARGDVVEVADFGFDVDVISDLEAHPLTGDVHYLSLGSGGANGHVHRLRFGFNLTPTAAFTVDPPFGDPPLLVSFEASASSDPENDPIEYSWDFGDGSLPVSGQAPQHTFTEEGLYTVTLTVTDDGGLEDTETELVAVGDVPPVARILSPLPGKLFSAPESLTLTGTGIDFTGGELTYEWTVDLYHDTHIHPVIVTLPGQDATYEVEPHGAPDELYYLRIELTTRNEGGLEGHDHVFVYPSENLSDPTGTALPIARVQELVPPYPLGVGNPDIEVVRDADLPPVGNGDRTRQYDTFHNGDQGDDDWIGFELGYTPYDTVRFTSLLFQEGLHYASGGWFEDLRVEVREGGVWEEVTGFKMLPGYPFQFAATPGFDGQSYDSFEIHFDPAYGDAVRLRGDPGGANGFISAGELRARIIEPVEPDPWTDLTGEGTIVNKLSELTPPSPQGEGNKDPEVIRNGTWPPVGSESKYAQVDTFHFGDQGDEDWVGYRFDGWRTFARILFQEGFHYPNGGWFEDLRVEFRADDASAWQTVSGLSVTPPIPGDTGPTGTYETFELAFDPVAARQIRIAGTPGGADGFIGVGELRVYGPGFDAGACGFATYGEEAGGTNVMALSSTTPPVLGLPVVLEVAGAPAPGPGTLLLGTAELELPVLGGTLLVSPLGAEVISIGYDAAGSAVLPASMPASPAFSGLTFYMQAVGFDPGQPGVALFSNGLEMTICP